jgi:hypothetical protein
MSISELNRRRFMQLSFGSMGAMALSHLATASAKEKSPHHVGQAKSVILCYMSGGFSHVDSFDPKPMLNKMHGQKPPMKVLRTQFDNVGKIMKSPWAHKQYGQSGLLMTNLFPHIAECADDLAIVRSMTADFSEHAQGNFFMHTGFPFLGHPSGGAWVNYGLGSMNEDLPGYIVLNNKTGIPHGGASVFGNGFLPATTGASFFNLDQKDPVRNIKPKRPLKEQRENLDFLKKLDETFAKTSHAEGNVNAAVANYETAFRMQTAVPELMDISKEPAYIKKAYGFEHKDPLVQRYAHQCLMARRLVEKGVRFIELSCSNFKGDGQRANPWDQHGNLPKGHGEMARQVDQPIATLINDLKQRGLLESTLIIFTGEFGRTPFSQGSNGRDHNPYGFSLWMAGGGIKGGSVHGSTDEFGYHAAEDKATIYDLWATVLHQLGMDHEKLTYRYSGRDMRLTDVHGNVLKKIIN